MPAQEHFQCMDLPRYLPLQLREGSNDHDPLDALHRSLDDFQVLLLSFLSRFAFVAVASFVDAAVAALPLDRLPKSWTVVLTSPFAVVLDDEEDDDFVVSQQRLPERMDVAKEEVVARKLRLLVVQPLLLLFLSWKMNCCSWQN